MAICNVIWVRKVQAFRDFQIRQMFESCIIDKHVGIKPLPLWTNSADDKSLGDNLCEMSKPIFWEKNKNISKQLSAEIFTQHAKH